SIRSVLQASGARPLTFWASAISTSHPASSRVSCTNRAPFIDSMAARTGSPHLAVDKTSVRRASVSGDTAVTSLVAPLSSSRCTSSRFLDRSNPAYNMSRASLVAPAMDTQERATGEAPLHDIQWSLRPVKWNDDSLRAGTLDAEKKNSLASS